MSDDHGWADAGVRKALQELRDANMSYSLVSNCVTALRLEQAVRDADTALSKPAPVAANASAELSKFANDLAAKQESLGVQISAEDLESTYIRSDPPRRCDGGRTGEIHTQGDSDLHS